MWKCLEQEKAFLKCLAELQLLCVILYRGLQLTQSKFAQESVIARDSYAATGPGSVVQNS